MRAVDLIEKKRFGGTLSAQEIEWLISGYVRGEIPDYQLSAFLMAVCYQGMQPREMADLTMSMMRSGDIIDLSAIPGIKVDKHSTGGVGDTTTLVVAPLVAACGGKVAKMSGRGLGHTGGTLDKLESIPGMRIGLPMEAFIEQVNTIGLAVIGQTDNLVPADKKLYALRDVTATVSSVPLIASSIMSKKLASGSDAIVLDVKVGSGAFVTTLEEARDLARNMVDIGKHLGRRVVAVITDMNQPLGLAVGNALEVREAVELLSGQLPEGEPLYEVCMLLGGHMLMLCNLAENMRQARGKLEHALHSGSGLLKLREMVRVQGGDETYIHMEKINALCEVHKKIPIYPEQEGIITRMHAARIGQAAQLLGAGRATKEDAIDPAVGLVMHRRLGDAVTPKEPLCTLYVNDESRIENAAAMLDAGIEINQQKTEENAMPMVYDVLE